MTQQDSKQQFIAWAEHSPHKPEFFQFMSILEQFFADKKTLLGEKGPYSKEIVRLHPSLSQSHAIHDIEDISIDDQEKFLMSITFMGLYGATSPLPSYFTDQLSSKEANQDSENLRAIWDILHHRLLSLFYRAGKKYRYDRQFQSQGQDQFSSCLKALNGGEYCGFDSVKLLRVAGLLTSSCRSALDLKSALQTVLQLPVEITQFINRTVRLGPQQMVRLGQANSSLGKNFIAGKSITDCQGKFRIHLGPLDLKNFRSFTPSGDKHKMLVKLVHFFITDNLDFDLELKLKADQVPIPKLNKQNSMTLGQLGWLPQKNKQDMRVIFKVKAN